MGDKLENLRLKLITTEDDEEEDKTQRKKHIRAKNCFLYSVIQVLCVLGLSIFLVFIACKVVEIQKFLKKKEKTSGAGSGESGSLESVIPGNDFCKSVNGENMTLVAVGYLNAIREEKRTMDARNLIYYVTDRLFTDQEACAIEALLRLFQDKTIFVIEIGNFSNTNHTRIDYITFLREQYSNLNRIRSTKQMFLKGSPFENYVKDVNCFSIFAAKVLLVWQFGGTVLSPNFLLLTRRLFDNNEGFCEVDRDLLFCPNQCSAYVYQLIKTLLDTMKPEYSMTAHDMAQHVVDKSVVDYCGDPHAMLVGCVGINRIKPYNICSKPNKDCDFLKVQEWKTKDKHWKTVVQKFCPKIVARFVPEVSQNETIFREIEDYKI